MRLFAILFALVAGIAPAAEVSYLVTMDLEAREWQVMVRFETPQTEDGTVDFWIPRWTPGAYHLAEYGKWAKDLTAADEAGNALAVERVDDCHWRIDAGDAAQVLVQYVSTSMSKPGMSMQLTVLDVEANRITPDYAYISLASLLGFVPELIDEPVRLDLEIPEGWQVGTALRQDGDSYVAPTYYRLEDSPLLFAPTLITKEFEVGGVPHGVSVYGVDEEHAAAITADCEKIVSAASRLMLGLPYDHYHFLIGLLGGGPGAGGGGLEHSFSTLILLPKGVPNRVVRGVIAHEHFHVWSAERLNVEAIHKPDFRERLETESLWFNEGITEYMARHVLHHAGFIDGEELLDEIASEFREAAPMARMLRGKSWTEFSREAADWKNLMDVMGFALRSYQLGPTVMLSLDLEMRRASEGERGLIDALRLLDITYRCEDRPLREGAIFPYFSGVAQADLSAFFRAHIAGPDNPDLAGALEVIGYRLRRDGADAIAEPSTAQERALQDFLSLPPVKQQ